LTVSKLGRSQMSKGSGDNEIENYNSLDMQCMTDSTLHIYSETIDLVQSTTVREIQKKSSNTIVKDIRRT